MLFLTSVMPLAFKCLVDPALHEGARFVDQTPTSQRMVEVGGVEGWGSPVLCVLAGSCCVLPCERHRANPVTPLDTTLSSLHRNRSAAATSSTISSSAPSSLGVRRRAARYRAASCPCSAAGCSRLRRLAAAPRPRPTRRLTCSATALASPLLLLLQTTAGSLRCTRSSAPLSSPCRRSGASCSTTVSGGCVAVRDSGLLHVRLAGRLAACMRGIMQQPPCYGERCPGLSGTSTGQQRARQQAPNLTARHPSCCLSPSLGAAFLMWELSTPFMYLRCAIRRH